MSADLRHLRVFCVLAEELHFGRTARRLRVAQSAVSTTLKALEDDVGALLLARTRRSVALTAAGRAFLEHAQRALGEVEAATRAARRAGDGQTGRLAIRFTLMSTMTVVPRTVARFLRTYPEVVVSLEPAATHAQIEALRAGHCQIGFVSPHHQVAPLAKEVVDTSPLVVVMGKEHPFAKRRRLAMKELAAERFLFLDEASEPHVHALFRRLCNRAGFEPNIVLAIAQVEALLSFVEAGVGIACVPEMVARAARHEVRVVPLMAPPRGGISVVWDPEQVGAPGLRFLEMLREEIGKRGAVTPSSRSRSSPRSPRRLP